MRFCEVCVIPDTERWQTIKKIHGIVVVSPNLSLPVLVLIKLPSLLSFPGGEIFIFQRQKHCLFYLNLIQFDETIYGTQCYLLTLKPVSSKKQLY